MTMLNTSDFQCHISKKLLFICILLSEYIYYVFIILYRYNLISDLQYIRCVIYNNAFLATKIAIYNIFLNGRFTTTTSCWIITIYISNLQHAFQKFWCKFQSGFHIRIHIGSWISDMEKYNQNFGCLVIAFN